MPSGEPPRRTRTFHETHFGGSFKGYRPRKVVHPEMKKFAGKIDLSFDSAYDDISFMRKQYYTILIDQTATVARRDWAKSVMLRLSIMMEVCLALGKLANKLEEESYWPTPSTEATEACEIARRHFPEYKKDDNEHVLL